jgi:hypothetical protein
MPLMHGKSDKVFSHNVRAEMDAGKPRAQSLAIAYSEKRKRMADGGEVPDSSPCDDHGVSGCRDCTMADMSDTPDRPASIAGAYAEGGMIDRIMKKKYPEGERMKTEEGEEAHEPDGASVEDPEPEDERDDMIGRIMKKRLAVR